MEQRGGKRGRGQGRDRSTRNSRVVDHCRSAVIRARAYARGCVWSGRARGTDEESTPAVISIGRSEAIAQVVCLGSDEFGEVADRARPPPVAQAARRSTSSNLNLGSISTKHRGSKHYSCTGSIRIINPYLMEVLAYEYAYQADPTFFNSSYCGKEKKIRDRIM
eukprot:SAG11_NODE_54_length_19571_cov_29.437786_21_plen_164_part_00